jgi:hypothetical protein
MDHFPGGVMMNAPLRTLLDLFVVLAVVAWACRFMWRRYGQPQGKQGNVCDNCRKCDH